MPQKFRGTRSSSGVAVPLKQIPGERKNLTKARADAALITGGTFEEGEQGAKDMVKLPSNDAADAARAKAEEENENYTYDWRKQKSAKKTLMKGR